MTYSPPQADVAGHPLAYSPADRAAVIFRPSPGPRGDHRIDALIQGLHHVTATVSDAQADVDFYVGLLGQRLVQVPGEQRDDARGVPADGAAPRAGAE